MDFAWNRTYRSRTGPATAQGPGWDHGFNVSLESQSDGTVILRTGDGRSATFYSNPWSPDAFLKKEEVGRHTPFQNKYRPQFYYRTTPKTYFETGDIPTEEQFWNLIDT